MQARGRLRPSPRRRCERGQIVPLVAIFALLLMATMALAADLGVTTAYKRSLQNVTDAAALAGAKQLPATPVLSDEQKATQVALQVVHNSFPWVTGGGSWWTPLITAGTVSGSQVSVTICAGMTTTTTCTPGYAAVNPGTATPFVVTVNVPPLATNIVQYRGLTSDVEVIMHQQAGTYFAGFAGQGPNQDGAQSIARHFAPNQPFPFALYSRTVIQAGNQGETIAGNIYADRFLQAQDSGHSGICAAPSTNAATGVTTPGYIYLGYPQQDDGTPPYQNDGQSTTKRSDPIIDATTCPTASGLVGMSGTNLSAGGCSGAYTGNATGTALGFDAADGACEANPAIQPPQVITPSPPSYTGTYCKQQGLVGGIYQKGEYSCPNGGTSLVVDHQLAAGIYEIDAGNKSGGCDVTMDGTILSLPDVTFYLKGGAGICITIPSGVTITQTPFLAGDGTPGDGRYIAYSDGVGNPSITLTSGGAGSTSGIWSITGVVLLPSGSVTINNKTALEDDGQIIVNTWNDQSGNHQNPSVSYNATIAGLQKEVLQLAE